MKRICVFCGSSLGRDTGYPELARRLARALARHDLGLVYGGTSVGLMGVLADTALQCGVEVIGVLPTGLVEHEIAHTGLTELRVVGSMHERKALMAELSDGFIALPGGLGTLEEFCEIVTWAQLGLHEKPCGLLDVGGYFELLTGFFDRAVSEQFMRPEHRAAILASEDPDELLSRFGEYVPVRVKKASLEKG